LKAAGRGSWTALLSNRGFFAFGKYWTPLFYMIWMRVELNSNKHGLKCLKFKKERKRILRTTISNIALAKPSKRLPSSSKIVS